MSHRIADVNRAESGSGLLKVRYNLIKNPKTKKSGLRSIIIRMGTTTWVVQGETRILIVMFVLGASFYCMYCIEERALP